MTERYEPTPMSYCNHANEAPAYGGCNCPTTCACRLTMCKPFNATRLHGGAQLTEEVRVVDPNTGGTKGQKMARFDMIPPDVLWELAEHYGKGEVKYPSDENGLANWQRGYNWGLSYAAMQRHVHQWLMGEEFDAETGSPHLVAAIWHLFALRWFGKHGKGTDFRPSNSSLPARDEATTFERPAQNRPRNVFSNPETHK